MALLRRAVCGGAPAEGMIADGLVAEVSHAVGNMENTPLPGKSSHVIRPYRPEDRATVRAICADTGFLGKPIDPAFEDRELFADYLTSYYTDAEPESTWVCEVNGEVKGYLMGSRFPKKKASYERWMLPGPGRARALALRDAALQCGEPEVCALDSDEGAQGESVHAAGRPPFSFQHPARGAQRPARRANWSIRFLQYLIEKGEKQVYAQVVTYESRRGDRMFARYGFRVIDQREVTKYRDIYPGKIHLFTVLKDLTVNSKLYGVDLHEEAES